MPGLARCIRERLMGMSCEACLAPACVLFVECSEAPLLDWARAPGGRLRYFCRTCFYARKWECECGPVRGPAAGAAYYLNNRGVVRCTVFDPQLPSGERELSIPDLINLP